MLRKHLLLKFIIIAGILLSRQHSAIGQIPTTWGNRTIAAGSKIIDLGVSPQSVANALKPFGLIYDLLKNKSIPILWALKPNKTKDAVDFVQDGISYKSGAFIIEAAFLSSAVNTVISNWTSQGVVVRTTTTSGSIPVFVQISAAPNWTIDQDNPNIAKGFIADAGIPISSYTTKTPSLLNSCDNVFAMPHADPTWANHNRIYSWVKPLDSTNGCRGWFWGGCHAVSILENLSNPAQSWQKMNFLSTNGLVPYGSHSDGSVPYINDSFPAHPFMQFLSKIDGATTNGSEQIYLPSLSSAWRPTTQVGVYDPSQANVPGLSPGKAAVLLFGPAFGNYNGGYVLYEAGHDISGSSAAAIAAERAFLNFSFLATVYQPQSVINSLNVPDTIYAGNSQTISVTVSGNGAPFTYQWSSTCPGVAFTAPTSSTTNITVPSPFVGSCTVTITVTNACGKTIFRNIPVYVKRVVVLPLQLENYKLQYKDNQARLNWQVANEDNSLSYAIERSRDGINFTRLGSLNVDPSVKGIYDYVDASVNQLQADVVYYRIRLVEKDGKERLSPIMVLRINRPTLTSPVIRPNPASSYINLNLYAKIAGTGNFILVNAEGITVLSKKINLSIGENNISVSELDKYPGGMYTAVIITGHEKVTGKFYILQ